MKITITGNEGYIGQYLKEKMPKGCELLLRDIKTGDDIREKENTKLCKDFHPDITFHLAAQTSVQGSFINPKGNFSTNVLGTLNIIQLGGKIIFASTGTVYGDRVDAEETDLPCPQSPYAMSKLVAEQHIIHSGLPYVILRIGNVYGRNNHRGVIRALKNGGKIFGHGLNARDYIYIDDVIEAMWQARKWKDGIYNIGTGKLTCVNEIADLLKIKSPQRTEPIEEQKFISLDINKAKKVGWKPKYKLKDYILK